MPGTYTKGRRGYYTVSEGVAMVYGLPGEVPAGNVAKGHLHPVLRWVARDAAGRLVGQARTRIKAVELLVDRHHGRGD